MCAGCLARRAAAETKNTRVRWAGLRRVVRMSVGIGLLWVVFHTFGAVLRSIPVDFHDGTVWRRPFINRD